MKNLKCLLTRCLLIALAISSPFIVKASTEINGLYYDLDTSSKTAALTFQSTTSSNYSSLQGEVVIPSTVENNGVTFTVTSISDKAFANCTSLTGISIPGTVTNVGTTKSDDDEYLPFYGCTSLKSVRFEDGSSDIYLGCYYYYRFTGKGLFSDCPLEEVYIGRNIKYKDNSSSYKFADYPSYYGYSAFYNQAKLAKVTIGEGCTELTDYLFYENAAITLLTFPKVKKIGKSTFEECTKLTTLNLGSSIENVGDRGFYNCTNITKLTFPNTTKSIGNDAFYNCTSITEVTVGNGLESIGNSAFYNCKSFTAIILPDCFTTMGESAFENCAKLTIAKLGKSLTSVPNKAFKNCISLSEMVIPGTAESIGDQAFYNDSTLAVITMNEGLKTIGAEVFYNNSGIMRFTIPGTVTSMGANSFYGCTNVTYLIFKDGTGTLNINNTGCKSSKIDALTTNTTYRDMKYDYFYDCPIRFLTIGKNITYSNYSASVSIYDPDKKTTVKRASAPFVNHIGIRSVTIGQNVTLLYHHLLNGCSSLTKLTIPSGMKYIYSYALANCPGITSLTLPNPLTLLDDYACANDTTLTSITFNEAQGNSLWLTIGAYALSNCPALTELTFPSKTATIEDYCFKNTPNITKVRFTDCSSSISLGYGSAKNNSLFGDCELQSLYMGRNISYDTSSADKSPFYQQSYLKDVQFSHSGTVTYCSDYLLYGVNNCKSLDLPESITELGKYTFAYMTVLDGINIPSKVSWLKEGLFSNDKALSSIIIHPAVVKMDSYIFANCSSLSTVTFEGDAELLEMGYGASSSSYGLFRNCPIETLNLNRWLSYNTEYASRAPFYSIATLKNLNIGENVKVIDKYMFSYCSGLETLYLPDNIESVGLWGFRGCTSLKSVRLSENLSQVSDYGFSGCTSLDNVKFPASMTSIADNSFSNCTSLKNVDLGDRLMIIGPAAFKNDKALEEINMPESLYGLGVEAFANCTSLRSVEIRGITSVSKQSFQGCIGLQWVSLSEQTTSLGEDSFDGCTGIKYIKSYAEFPPEGLVNFPELVPQEGTLFVPEYSVDYYLYSPTWENWLDIRPLNENILVSSVDLDRSEVIFKASETTQLNATIGNEDATDKTIIWKSSDENVVTVENGMLTAISVGNATITASAADGSGQKAMCAVTVEKTFAESIALSESSKSIKPEKTFTLVAEVYPASATDKTLTWHSDNEAVATVDKNGVVTAVYDGVANVTAVASDGSQVFATCVVTVVPPLTGDSNDDDNVTITDAVNTANYAMGIECESFNYRAADVNNDSRITISDASGTITEVLNQSLVESNVTSAKNLQTLGYNYCEDIWMNDFTINLLESKTIFLQLMNSSEYTALQTDVKLPDGLEITSVNTENINSNHIATYRNIGKGVYRIVIYSMSNESFDVNEDTILGLTITAKENFVGGHITIDNVIGADINAKEYKLASKGACGSIGSSGVGNMLDNKHVKIESNSNGVYIYNAKDEMINIYTVNGILIRQIQATKDVEYCSLTPGVYVISVDAFNEKVIVK